MITRLDIALRIAGSQDIAQLCALYAAAVRRLAPGHYTPDQIAVWLIKRHREGQKVVGVQIHRALDSLRQKFCWQGARTAKPAATHVPSDAFDALRRPSNPGGIPIAER